MKKKNYSIIRTTCAQGAEAGLTACSQMLSLICKQVSATSTQPTENGSGRPPQAHPTEAATVAGTAFAPPPTLFSRLFS